MIRFLNWWNGWRQDMDGWWVRARRPTDPDAIASSQGFVEESAIAVREPWMARDLDRGAR